MADGIPPQSNPYNSQVMTEIARWMESWDEDLIYVYHYLNGEVYDPSQNPPWLKLGDPLLNEKGRQFIVSILYPIMNKNTWMRKLTEERVHNRTWDLTDTITAALYYNWNEWGVKPEVFDAIVEVCMHAIESAYSRAQDGGEREWLKKAVHEIHSVSSDNIQKQGWNPFGLLGKKG